MSQPHVVIIGAGFGGLRAAQALANEPVQVTLVDRRNYHLFQPLLYQVATAGLAPGDISYPIRKIFHDQRNFSFRMDEVTGVQLADKRLITRNGDLSYDYLIMAVGGITNHFGMQSVADNSIGLKNVEDALSVRNHVLRMFERAAWEKDAQLRRGLLTFVIVGGGPTGVESAGAMSELVSLLLNRDYPHLDPSEVNVLLVEASSRLLAGMSDSLSDYTVSALKQKQVDVRLNTLVTEFNGACVTLKSGECIPAHTLLWAAGVKAAGLVHTLGVELASMNRIVVEPTLQIPGHPEAFVIGDAAFFLQDNQPLPMVAPVAVQQADLAVANIKRHAAGTPLAQFTYKSPGVLATIGRNKGVASMGNSDFSGFFAWFLWLVVHIVRLIGFRNRLVVLINWAWDYFFGDRAERLIMPQTEVDPHMDSAGKLSQP